MIQGRQEAASHKRTLFWGRESVTLIGTNTITTKGKKKEEKHREEKLKYYIPKANYNTYTQYIYKYLLGIIFLFATIADVPERLEIPESKNAKQKILIKTKFKKKM